MKGLFHSCFTDRRQYEKSEIIGVKMLEDISTAQGRGNEHSQFYVISLVPKQFGT